MWLRMEEVMGKDQYGCCFLGRDPHKFENEVYLQLRGLIQLQSNLKQMLNANSFPISPLKNLNLFSSNNSPLPNLKSTKTSSTLPFYATEPNRMKPADGKPTQSLNQVPTLGCNNMYDQVNWFNQQNFHEVTLKIGIILVLGLVFFCSGIIGFQTFVCFDVIASLLFALQHGLFQIKALQRWAEISLLGSTFVLINQIFTSTLNFISSPIADGLSLTHLSLAPAFLVTSAVIMYYIQSSLILNPFQVCQRKIKKSIINYPNNLAQVIRKLYLTKYTILRVYCISFLVLYIGISLVQFSHIFSYGNECLILLRPSVVLAQLLTFIWVVIAHHAALNFVDQPVLWNFGLPSLYSKLSAYTKVPIILELLKVVSTEQVKKDLVKSGNLQLFNVMSLSESRRENNLNRQKMENIYIHSLAFLISCIDRQKQCLQNKIYIYSSTSLSLGARESKVYTSYEAMFLEFANQELSRCLQKMYEFSQSVEQVQILKWNKKSFFEDLFYYLRVEFKLVLLQVKIRECARYLQICDYMLQIMLLNDLDTNRFGVGPVLIKVGKLREIMKMMGNVSWLSAVMRDRMEAMARKGSKILTKVEK